MTLRGSHRQSKLYWQNALADFNAATFPHLKLPDQNPKANDIFTYHISTHTHLKMPPNATIPVLIWASWGLVIGCLTNSDDVIFGVAVSGENASIDGTNSLVEQGTAVAPVRINLNRNSTIADYLNRIYKQGREMAPFEHIGLDNIANVSPDSRQASEFQSLLIIQTRETGNLQLPLTGWTGQSLLLHILHDAESISISATFDATVVEPWVVEGALKQFASLFQQLQQSSATTTLADLELVTRDDLETIWSWNGNTLPSIDLCIHTIIEQHARDQPEVVSVQAWDGQLTYSELNKLSSVLAHRLVELGIGPNQLIPLCFEKSMWTIIALLGVLKAGSGFVLLDPSLPQERLRTIAHQTHSNFILSSISSHSVSMQLLDRVIVINSEFFVNISSGPLFVPEPDPASAMYVVFISGSTGTPKGAIISHRNFSSAMAYQLGYYKVADQMRMFDFASYSFVASIANLFIALTAGGCICIPSEHDKRNRLAESIVSLRANVIHLTPSASRLITPDLVPKVELVIFSGEGLHAEDIKVWWGKVRVMNVLGLSECAPRSVLNVDAQSPEQATRIGKGIGQVTWVVDPEDRNRLMPIGAVGELLLEGPLVGLGYLNDEGRTAQSFIHSTRWLVEGCPSKRSGRQGRLYKTGDLVRYNQDGSLSYVARKDAQVKLRGQRVELGEVEYQIKEALANVEKVVVDVISPQREKASNPILAAFTQPNGLPSVSATSDLYKATIFSVTPHNEERLARYLPSYMIPTLFFTMSKLPTTPTGKIDRRKLRALGSSFSLQELADLRTTSLFPKRKPSTKLEQQIQSLWSQLLNLKLSSIGLNDTFVQLGGDSLGAMKLVSEAREIGLALSVADVLGSLSTLEEVASKVQQVSLHSPVAISAFQLLPQGSDLQLLSDDMQRRYGIQKEAIADIYPCTPLQEGLFSLSVTQGDYVAQRILRLASDIDLNRFRTAWETVFEGFEVLRTRIIAPNDGRLLQVVINQPVSFVTATGLEQYLEADKAHQMSPGLPLIRFALVKDEIGLYKHFVLTVHHALYDGWSMRLILDSVEKVYHGWNLNSHPRFNGFIDYVYQQNAELVKSYWLGFLDGYNGTPFPPMAPTVSQSSIDTRFRWGISVPNMVKLKVTMSSLIRAAWALTVGRWVDANDIVFGVLLSGRNAPIPDIEKMAAPTIATVPVRVQWDEHSMIVDYLQTVQKQAIEMIPFEQSGLRTIAKLGGGCRRACEFQTLLLVQPDISPIEETLGEWNLNEYQELNTYALTVEVKLSPGGITVHAGFDCRIIEAQRVQNLVQSFQSVLHQLSIATPSESISNVDIMTTQDIERIWNWNNSLPKAIDGCIHTLIADQALTCPTSLAVHAWDATLSYEKLDRLSSILAWRLQECGLSSGDIIPLCFEKSAWIIVLLLAVIKAGGTFVLLDNALPEQRLQVIVQQVNARMILSSIDCHNLSQQLAKMVISVSANLFSDLENQPKRQLSSPTPDSILYVAFTSGSTGVPRGAQVSHRNFASAIHHQTKQFAYDKSWRVFDFASYSFDMSIFAILYTLAAGACLCIPNDEDRKSDLPNSINNMQADSIILTPSVLRTLHPTQVSCLKSIMSIGEPMCRDDVTPWVDAGIKLANAYGPAECTPVSTINSNVGDGEGNPHIGRGLGHITWVVDTEDHNRLVPIGKVGELLLEGPLVGCGYLGNPEKSQAVFIEDPSWLLVGSKKRPGRHGRLYKTGDLVSYNNDGTLNYISRKDNQVKIRGQRVELGEVEHHVKECVADAVQVAAEIIPSGEPNTKPVLVAFVTKTSINTKPSSPTVETTNGLEPDVEKALIERLPSYMIPVAIFQLEEMPMTATEKTDRKKLRIIGSELLARQVVERRTNLPKSKQQPSTPIEVQLRRIWSRVLNINEIDIGIDDSFLQLGGDSITAMQVSSLARAVDINISSADVLRVKTISTLSAVLTVASPLASHVVHSSKYGGKNFPLSPMQNLYMHLQPSPNAPYDQNFFLRLKTKIPHAIIATAIEVLAKKHSILRARFFQDNEETWQQTISQDISGSIYICTKQANEAVADAIAQCRDRLDIIKGPMVAACIIDEDENQDLFLSIHHLVVDLVSWIVLLRDLESILTSKVNVASASLDFQTWVSLQEEYTAASLKIQASGLGKLKTEYLEYWGMDSLSNKSDSILTRTFALNTLATSAILGYCNNAFGTRPVELMMAAIIHSFGSTFTARQSPTVINEGHGREPWNSAMDISDTVGWFTTMSPVKVASDVNYSMEDVIRLTKDSMRRQPQNGWENFTSLCKDGPGAAEFANQFPVEILFNYVGIYQQLEHGDTFFEKLQLPRGCDPLARLEVQRFALFDIGARVEKGSLIVSVAYDKYMNHQGKICDWVNILHDTMTNMSSELLTINPCWTLTDFPLTFKTYDEIHEFSQYQLNRLGVKHSDVEDIFPCSPLQQGVLAACARDARNYRAKFSVEVRIGPGERTLDISKLEMAWKEVVRRYALLRSLLINKAGKRRYAFHVVLKVPLPSISRISKLDSTAQWMLQHEISETYGHEELQHHLVIHEIDAKTAYLELHISHAIMDGFSLQILWKNLQEAYNISQSPTGSYKYFVEYLDSQPRDAATEFWSRRLQNIEPCILPASVVGQNSTTFENIQVPIESNAVIKSFCSTSEITTATLIRVAWALVLRLYTGSLSPCFGNINSGRDVAIPHVDKIFGPLISMAPCLISLENSASVLKVLKAAQQDYLDSLPYQHLPLREIHHMLGLKKKALFNSIVSFQRSWIEEDLNGLSVHHLDAFDPNEV